MTPLLADPRTSSVDIIAIQKEPWHNSKEKSTHCPSRSPFSLLHDKTYRRSCFLINKAIDPETWSVSFLSPDICSLSIQTPAGLVHIHNVYAPPIGSYSATECPPQLLLLPDLLRTEGEHLLVGDFNFHHPIWSGVTNPTKHVAADHLVQITYEAGLELATPPGLITRSFNGQETRIDLAFVSPLLLDHLTQCDVAPDLDHGSDHKPVQLTFKLEVVRSINTPQKCWKLMDRQAILAEAQMLYVPEILQNEEDVEQYCAYLSDFIESLADRTVPLRKSSPWAAPWWTAAVQEAVSEARRLRWKG